jgi:hypothetical protein
MVCFCIVGIALSSAQMVWGAAPPKRADGSSSSTTGSPRRIQALADAIRAEVRSHKDAAQLLKAFSLDPSDPSSVYLADATIIDPMRSKAPLPALSESKQNETLAQIYVTARMKGKGPDQVAVELDQALQYATGQKPLHELNVPEGQRFPKGTCPHDRCANQMTLQGRVSMGLKAYDQFVCPAGHETLLRVN